MKVGETTLAPLYFLPGEVGETHTLASDVIMIGTDGGFQKGTLLLAWVHGGRFATEQGATSSHQSY